MDFQEQVSPEIAVAEVERWLNAKRVTPKRREALKEQIDTISSNIVYGILSISEDNAIVHNLLSPLPGFAESLEYKPRLRIEEAQSIIKNLKISVTDMDGRILATMAALTGKPVGVLSKLDTEDVSIAQAITVFFL